jgi:hypothetical protein
MTSAIPEVFRNPAVILCVKRIRRNQVSVNFFDEGGFDGLNPSDQEDIITKVVDQLMELRSCRVVVRAVRVESWRVTLATVDNKTGQPALLLRF